MNRVLIEADKQTRNSILDVGQSFIIQAPAGSGKTECLTQRYLALLADGVHSPEEIIAITFTRKATHEMHTRILDALELAKQPKPLESHRAITWELAVRVLANDKKYQWNLCDNPSRLRIMTIDAMCHYLIRQIPLANESGGLFQVLEQADTLYEHAVDNLLNQLSTNGMLQEELYQLADYFNNDIQQLKQLFITMLKTRSNWQAYLLHPEATLPALIQNRRTMVEYFIHQLDRLVSHRLPELQKYLQEIDISDADEIPYWKLLIQAKFKKNSLEEWKILANLLLTQKNTWRTEWNKRIGMTSNAHNKPIIANLKECIRGWQSKELHDYLNLIKKCPDIEYTAEELTILDHLISTLLPLLTYELNKIFIQQQKIDFTAVALSAEEALINESGMTDLALRLDYEIKHLLVDEFQDTSIIQYQLLCQLTAGWLENDGRNLFLVGDPMQAIYRFRQAEVCLFTQIQESGLPNVSLNSLNLYQNFRSHSSMVDWFNSLCQIIFPPINHPRHSEIAYTPSVSPFINDQPFSIQCFFDETALDLADRTVALCQSTLSTHPNAKIAILTRSRKHVQMIIESLYAAQLPFSFEGIMHHQHNPIIRDLIELTCALLDPLDRIAWLACLRSPYCGLTLIEITELIDGRQETILDCCRQSSISSIKRWVAIIDKYAFISQQLPISDWLENFWIDLGGYQLQTSSQYYETCRSYFHYLKTLTHPICRQTILATINTISIKSNHHDHAIQILTIHKAKGLEFDTVIIPHCEKTTHNENDDFLLHISEWYHPAKKQHLLLMCPKSPTSDTESLFNFINREEIQKNNSEILRLFYVAITRAKSNLYFLNHIKKETKKYTPKLTSFLHFLMPCYQTDLDTYLLDINNKDMHKSRSVVYHSLEYVDTSACHQVNHLLNDSLYHRANHHITAQNNSSLNTHIGTIVHQYLYQFSLLPRLSLDLLPPIRENLAFVCLSRGIQQADITRAVSVIEHILAQCLNDPMCLWILSQREKAYSEFSVVFNNKTKRIDRTFWFKNEQFIIDYKVTDQTADTLTLSKIQALYGKQLQEYADLLESYFTDPIRCGIYLPLQQQFFAWPARQLIENL